MSVQTSEEESDEEFNPELFNVGQGINHITSANDVNDAIQNVFMVFEDQLLSLANSVVPMTCTSEGCLTRVELSTECVGSAVIGVATTTLNLEMFKLGWL